MALKRKNESAPTLAIENQKPPAYDETMNRIYLQPAEGLKVRQPDGLHLPPEGKEVVRSPYWDRRLADGDVIEVKPKKEVR